MNDKEILTSNFMGFDGFVWFFGVVEDRNDPLRLGRCKVRIYGIHPTDHNLVTTDDLPWAMPIQPIYSAAFGGIGHAPVGPIIGTQVFGFFLDGRDAQIPFMLGTVAGGLGHLTADINSSGTTTAPTPSSSTSTTAPTPSSSTSTTAPTPSSSTSTTASNTPFKLSGSLANLPDNFFADNSPRETLSQTGNMDEVSAKFAVFGRRMMNDSSLGLTVEQVSGILGFAGGESHLVPNVLQRSTSGPHSHGNNRGSVQSVLGKLGYGWAQWTAASRQNAFLANASELRLNPQMDEANYSFFIKELKTTESRAFKDVKKCKTVEGACIVMVLEYGLNFFGIKNPDQAALSPDNIQIDQNAYYAARGHNGDPALARHIAMAHRCYAVLTNNNPPARNGSKITPTTTNIS